MLGDENWVIKQNIFKLFVSLKKDNCGRPMITTYKEFYPNESLDVWEYAVDHKGRSVPCQFVSKPGCSLIFIEYLSIDDFLQILERDFDYKNAKECHLIDFGVDFPLYDKIRRLSFWKSIWIDKKY